MKLISCVMIMICPFVSWAQGVQDIKALTIGDSLPAFTVGSVANYSSTDINMSRFRDRVILIDFMTTGCSACIQALPHLDSLQHTFGNRLQILLVTPESRAQVGSFLQRKNIAGLALPVVANDTVLQQMFLHTYIPHEVLINKGKVMAITYPEYITEAVIAEVTEDKFVNLPVKHDISDFAYDQPLLQLNEKTIPDFSHPENVKYSTVTSYMSYVPERFTTVRDTPKKMLRISMINAPIVELYSRALYGPGLRPAFIVFNVKDTNAYAYHSNVVYSREWLAKNAFCYEGSFPIDYPLRAIGKKISSDLDFFFSLNTHLEKRNISCWVISKDSSAAVANHTNETKELVLKRERRISVEGIVYAMNSNYGATPVIDESGCGGLFLYGLHPTDYNNVTAVGRKLVEYGLQIIRRTRQTDVLVITEDNQKYFKK
jgi:thiol-disulfide isomerase/thioredoxin